MAKAYVSEYGLISPTGILQEPPTVEQTVTFTTTTQSSAFAASTTVIRVHTDGICSIQVGSSPVATTSMKRLIAGQTEYFLVGPGQKIAFVTNT